MSVTGIDLGSLNSVIAVARNRGVDVITNEVSNRSTPSLVAFGRKTRSIGESAKTQEISNPLNTIGNLTRLVGRSIQDKDIAIEQQYVSSPIIDMDGHIGFEVEYLGQKERFTAVQTLAMFLTKKKQIVQTETKQAAFDLVLSCPAWFTERQRRAIIDAAHIAGWNVLRLLSCTTAAALGYGITKRDLPAEEEKSRKIAFVDIGYSNHTCCVVEFRQGFLKVLSVAYDRHFGGRNFDYALLNHFAKEFLEKYKIDVLSNLKARCRVLAACEKVKKVLSANAVAPLNIESLMNDIDVSSSMKREQFEELLEPFINRVTIPIEQALAQAKITVEEIDGIEMVGGAIRVPAIKNSIQNFFKKPLSYTLNQDEAIARGCAFACAISSPAFKVRDFIVEDICLYPIDIFWEKTPDIPDEGTCLTVFNSGSITPCTKMLTLYRKNTFELEARYSKPEELPISGGDPNFISHFTVKIEKPLTNPENFYKCRLKTRLDVDGFVAIESACAVEDKEVEEPIEIPDGMEVDGGEQPRTRKVKKTVRVCDFPLTHVPSSLQEAVRNLAIERENQMIMEDKLVLDTEIMKNELESYIYEIRGSFEEGGNLFEHSVESERQKLREKATDVEDWLYSEGEDASKAIYLSKLEELRAIAGPVLQRYQDKLQKERERERKALEAAAKEKQDEERKKNEEAAAANASAPANANPPPTADAAPSEQFDQTEPAK